MWCAAHVQHLQWLWRWSSMILKWDDGTSGMSPAYSSMASAWPSVLSWHALAARAGEHDLEQDDGHAPAGVFSFRVFVRSASSTRSSFDRCCGSDEQSSVEHGCTARGIPRRAERAVTEPARQWRLAPTGVECGVSRLAGTRVYSCI